MEENTIRRKRLEERLREEEALRPVGARPLEPHELPAFESDAPVRPSRRYACSVALRDPYSGLS